MISEHYIQTAISIRSEFLDLNNQIEKYDESVKIIGRSIQDLTDELISMRDNISKYKSASEVEKLISKKLQILEVESIKLEKIIEPINQKIEDLQKREKILYQSIKDKYPDYPDEELIKEIQDKLPR